MLFYTDNQPIRSFYPQQNYYLNTMLEFTPSNQQIYQSQKTPPPPQKPPNETFSNHKQTFSSKQEKIKQFLKPQTTSSLAPMIITLVLFSILPVTESVSSIPLQYDPFPHLESAVVSVYPSYSYSTTTTYYTFQKAKRVRPHSQNIFLGLHSIDYQANELTYSNDFRIYFSLSYWVSSQTTLQLNIGHRAGAIYSMRVSILVIQNDFFYRDIYSSHYMYIYQNSTDTSLSSTITLLDSTYSIMYLLTRCNIVTQNSGNGEMGIVIDTQTISFPSFTTTFKFMGNHYISNVTYRVLVWYPSVAKTNYNIDVQAVDYALYPSPYYYDIGFTDYKYGRSILMIGLSRFNYIAIDSPSDLGFYWYHYTGYNSTDKLVISTSIDDQFSQITTTYLLINRIYCPSSHPLRGTNWTTLETECFDECYQNQYVDYYSPDSYHMCLPCGDILCKSCQSATKCSSCVYGYDLNEITQDCTLNSGFYLVGSYVYLCSNALTGCKNCTSDGYTCTKCFSLYYLSSSGSCMPCNSIATDCIKCSSTECYKCKQPKFLINGTLCSLTIPKITPPQPFIPCTDANCFECSLTNRSECLFCISQLFQLINGQCIPHCGDGSILENVQICDDSNTLDFDGCSSDCRRVEENFTCTNIPSTSHPTMFQSLCSYTGSILVSLVSIYKHPKQNTVNILLTNSQPNLRIWQDVNMHQGQLKEMFTLKIERFNTVDGHWFDFNAKFLAGGKQLQKELINGGQVAGFEATLPRRMLQSSFASSGHFDASQYEYILLQLSYTPSIQPLSSGFRQSLSHQTLSLEFTPSLNPHQYFALSTGNSLQFPLITQNNHLIQYYSQQHYTYSSLTFYIGTLVSICALVLLLLSVVSWLVDGKNSRSALIAIQTICVGQFVFYEMIEIQELNPFFIQLVNGLQWINGFDILLGQSDALKVRQLHGIGITSLSVQNNVNVSLVIVLLPVIVGSFMLLVDRIIRPKHQTSPSDSYMKLPHTQLKKSQNTIFQQPKQQQTIQLKNEQQHQEQKQSEQEQKENQEKQNQTSQPTRKDQSGQHDNVLQIDGDQKKENEQEKQQEKQQAEGGKEENQKQLNKEQQEQKKDKAPPKPINLTQSNPNNSTPQQHNLLQPQPIKPIPQTVPQSRLYRLGNFLVYNLGFMLFLLFFYKFLFCISIQIQHNLSAITIIDMVIAALVLLLTIFYLLSILISPTLYDTLTDKIISHYGLNITEYLSKQKQLTIQKINTIQQRFDNFIKLLPQKQKSLQIKQLYNKKINVRFWYIIIVLIQPIFNIAEDVFLQNVIGQYANCVPTGCYVLILLFFIYNQPYKGANLYRLYSVLCISIIIQSLILTRSILSHQNVAPFLGTEQSSIGSYIAFSVSVLLLLMNLVALTFSFYSIKKLRCCQLQIEWERVKISNVMRFKLQDIVRQQCGENYDDDDKDNDIQGKLNPHKDIHTDGKKDHCQHTEHNCQQQHKHNLNDQYSSFHSTNSLPFFNLRKQVSTIHNMINQKRHKNPQDYNSREINRQVTAKILKKEIKQKLLNSKIQRKIQLKEGLKNQQIWQAKKNQQNTTNIIDQRSNRPLKAKKGSKLRKQSLTPNDPPQQVKIFDDKGHLVDYIYTDTKTYDVYQEFDMI